MRSRRCTARSSPSSTHCPASGRRPRPAAARRPEGATTQRARLDAELVRRGLARSRTDAHELIAAGRVTVGGALATKPATRVGRSDPVAVADPARRWVSRGGYKLDDALDRLAVDVTGRVCLDAGASTGGFTDVLLARGAVRVIAVDVGYGQLAWRLRTDERVVVLERTNVRHLEPGALPSPPPEVVVADLSFISLAVVLPALVRVAAGGADFVVLVKPQFEAGRAAVGRGGVVRDPAVWEDALRHVAAAARASGLGVAGACASALPGPAGNVEFFLHLRPDAGDDLDRAVRAALAQGRDVAAGRSG